jgi:uridine kinase
MVVIHIAGAPASGKSTLGTTLQTRFPSLIVLDLDDVNREFAEAHGLVSLTQTSPAQFQALYQEHLDDLMYKAALGNQSLVFVGIEAAILGSWPGKHFLTVDLHADVHLCLDTPTADNVQRWIQRDMPEVIDEFATSLKQDVTQHYTQYRDNERAFVKKLESNFHALMRDFRPSQRTRDIERFKAYYKRRGFKFVSPNAAVRAITKLIETL